MNTNTGLPVVDESKCTSCGACVKACPRYIIELRNKGPKGHRVYVQCVSKDKGVIAKKACSVACIGCGKCEKVCEYDAITIENNLSYIDLNSNNIPSIRYCSNLSAMFASQGNVTKLPG